MASAEGSFPHSTPPAVVRTTSRALHFAYINLAFQSSAPRHPNHSRHSSLSACAPLRKKVAFKTTRRRRRSLRGLHSCVQLADRVTSARTARAFGANHETRRRARTERGKWNALCLYPSQRRTDSYMVDNFSRAASIDRPFHFIGVWKIPFPFRLFTAAALCTNRTPHFLGSVGAVRP